jgi:hypothetical protein
LFKAAAYFDIPSAELTNNADLLAEIFTVRNQISHEMDIDFSQPVGNRRPRDLSKMLSYTSELLNVLKTFLYIVESKLG